MVTSSARSTNPVPSMPPALTIRHLSKVFSGTQALHDVALDVAAGTIHGLVGENGSGKSTLIKTLSGFHAPEPGAEITVAGQRVDLPISAVDLDRLRVRFVHQDLTLAMNLTVAENLFVDELATRVNWLLRTSALRRRARELLAPYGRDLDPAAKISALSPADQAHLAIVRALSRLHGAGGDDGRGAGRGILVLDEVTAFLSSSGRDQLFHLIREVAAQGDSVLFVSHYLDEVLEITSRITVLRDGRLISSVDTGATSENDLVELIVGRAVGASLKASHAAAGARTATEPATRTATETATETSTATTGAARDVTVAGLTGQIVDGLDFAIRPGEVLGLAGLLGSGFEEVPALIFGAAPAAAGRLQLAGQDLDLATMTPVLATRRGLAFVPENRHTEGAVGALTVEENVTLQILPRFENNSMLQRRRLRRETAALLEEYDVRPRNPRAEMSSLSGGNAQKVIMAKWLTTEPSLLLLYEPTHGVDVGSREQILLRVRQAARDGLPVLCASADPEQLADLCDRVLVLARGRVVAELTGDRLTKDAIVEASYMTAPASQGHGDDSADRHTRVDHHDLEHTDPERDHNAETETS